MLGFDAVDADLAEQEIDHALEGLGHDALMPPIVSDAIAYVSCFDLVDVANH